MYSFKYVFFLCDNHPIVLLTLDFIVTTCVLLQGFKCVFEGL